MKILRCLMGADLRCGHEGLKLQIARQKLDLSTLEEGDLVVFINNARDKIKVFASGPNLFAYYRAPKGSKIDLKAIQYIPRAFQYRGLIDYEQSLKEMLEREVKK